MLKSFSVKNFRNLNIDKLEFKRINILVGPNNSGKSNLIDAISFFSNLILSEKKDSAFLDELSKKKHGWDDLLNKRHEKPGRIDMRWVLNTDKKYPDLSYELQFQVGTADQIPRGFFITNEQLRYRKPVRGQIPFEYIRCHGNTPGKGHFSVRDKKTGQHNRVILDVNVYDTVFRQLSSTLLTSWMVLQKCFKRGRWDFSCVV